MVGEVEILIGNKAQFQEENILMLKTIKSRPRRWHYNLTSAVRLCSFSHKVKGKASFNFNNERDPQII